MNLFKNIKQKGQNAGQLLIPLVKPYLEFKPEEKEIILKEKAVLFLCTQAQTKSEKLKSLKPDEKQGLIAEIQHQNVNITIHFTPELITIKEDCIEGQLKLLKKPDIKTDSMIYNILITGWKVFLGGNIPQSNLPENIKVEGDKVFYTFPRHQLKILEVLLKSIKSDSTFITNLEEGKLIIQSNVSLDWSNVNIQDFLSILNKS
jgi:hypothetical protein